MSKFLILDCDGVLTDGKKNINKKGERDFITFNSRDNEAVKMFVGSGFEVFVVTASNFIGIKRYWENNGATVLLGCKNKMAALMDKVLFENAIGVGDDLMDVEFLNACAFSFVPADAHPLLVEEFDNLDCFGGFGVVAHLWADYLNKLDHDIFVGTSLEVNTNRPVLRGALRGYSKNGKT